MAVAVVAVDMVDAVDAVDAADIVVERGPVVVALVVVALVVVAGIVAVPSEVEVPTGDVATAASDGAGLASTGL
ncbi:MAG: hypothetical protein HOQ27_15360, partial [Dermatophilaceae bacterium]|nr:hypothetical protein [Dermatophilaceae bacterium]